MNQTAFFLSLLLTVEMLEWTDAPLKRAIAHASGQSQAEYSQPMVPGGVATAPNEAPIIATIPMLHHSR